MIPEGDLFQAIRRGDASMVTGEIETFTETGIQMTDGTAVEADVIVSATGLNMLMMDGVPFTIDGKPLDFSQSFTHRAILFTGARTGATRELRAISPTGENERLVERGRT